MCVLLHSYEIIPYWPDLGSSQQIRPGLNFFHVHPFPGSNKEKKCIHLGKKYFLLKWISFEWIYIHILQMFKMRKQLQWQFSVKQLTVWGVKFASVWCCLPCLPATNEWTQLCSVAWCFQACFRKHKTHATITQVLMHIFHNLVGHSIHCYHLQTASVQLNLPYYKFNLRLDLKQVWP